MAIKLSKMFSCLKKKVEKPLDFEISSSKLVMDCEICSTCSGTVRRAILLRKKKYGGPIKVAVKTFSLVGEFSVRGKSQVMLKIDFLRRIQHKNILNFYGIVDTVPLMVVMEYMPNGSLLSFLRAARNKDFLTLPVLMGYALQVAEAMEYLEKQGLVHQQLKAENILVGEDKMHVKISDHGLLALLDKQGFRRRGANRDLAQRIKWKAPENFTSTVATLKGDVWSYGVCLWEIFTLGADPYSTLTINEIFDLVPEGYRLPVPPACPPVIEDLIAKCHNVDPELRPSFAYIADTLRAAIATDFNVASRAQAAKAAPIGADSTTVANGSTAAATKPIVLTQLQSDAREASTILPGDLSDNVVIKNNNNKDDVITVSNDEIVLDLLSPHYFAVEASAKQAAVRAGQPYVAVIG
eukprot:Colp12_sorted_trinity150504_noHs@30359